MNFMFPAYVSSIPEVNSTPDVSHSLLIARIKLIKINLFFLIKINDLPTVELFCETRFLNKNNTFLFRHLHARYYKKINFWQGFHILP